MAIDLIHFTPGNVDITLTPPTSPQSVGLALAGNEPFPNDAFTDGAIPLGSIGTSASKDFKLDGVKFLKDFSVGGKFFAGFGVYRSADKLIAALRAEGLDEPMVGGPLFPDDETKNLCALRWGYDASASVSGSVALGAGVTFGASGRTAGLYALVRSLDRNEKALKAIVETLNSWKMPREIAAPADLERGTWVIAETDGEIKFNLGVEYGYNYNWARKSLNLGGLNGDFGLKIEMGIQAQLGFSASGRYATVVSRESDRNELRLRVFRLRQQGWTFAFDAGVGAQVQQSIFPKNFDDFVKGIFNVNGQQALKDIADKFEKWTDSKNQLKDLLGAELASYAEELGGKLVKDVTGKDPQKVIEETIALLKKPVELWRGLPHEVTSVIYGLLRDKLPLDELRDFLKDVIDETDPKKLASRIEEELREVNFFETAIGKWLTAAATKGITSLLANIEDERQLLVDLADKTVKLLDGSTVEETLKKLQDEIEERLGLSKILAVTDKLSFDNMDKWLKKRLSDFLGETAALKSVQKIVNAINRVRAENVAKEFYDKGLKALAEKYRAEFHFSYQKTTTKTALMDVTFDFDADEATARAQLKKALQGDVSQLLAKQMPGVKLNKGVLTHGMKRRTHIEVNLPFFKSVTEHITESLVNGEAVDEKGDGRIWIFNLKATDTVSKRHMLSRLAVTLQFSRKPGLRQFSSEEFTYSSTLRMTRRNARREFIEDKLGIVVGEYLASEFDAPGKQPFSQYLTALDKALDDKGIKGDNNFGNLLTGFDVSLPSEAFAAWKSVSADKKDFSYVLMSRHVQELLRRFVPLCYVDDRDRYKELVAIYPLLVYSALPPINRVKYAAASSKLTRDDKDVYQWDVRDGNTRAALLHSKNPPTVADNLKKIILPRVRAEMSGMSEQVLYADDRIDDMLDFNGTEDKKLAIDNFVTLVQAESDTINGIRDAAVQFRKSVDSQDLEKAVASLDEFGSTFVETFNDKLGGRYGTTTSRPLGALLFTEAASYFGKTAAKTQPTAMLELIVLPEQTTFKLDDYLTGERPEGSAVALQQRIVSAGG